MANVNKCIFIGTLVRDVELRVTPSGTAIGTFSLAINRKWRDAQGGEKEEVSFLEFEAWAKTAETISKYTQKGRQLYVEARAKQDNWEDKDTKKKRSKIKFVVDNFQFIGSKRDDNDRDDRDDRDDRGSQGESDRGRGYSSSSSTPKPSSPPPPQENLDEDVPF